MKRKNKQTLRDLSYIEPDILFECINLLPDLRLAAFAAARARAVGFRYPLTDHKDLRPLFGEEDEVESHGSRFASILETSSFPC